METLEILSDKELIKSIDRSLRDLRENRVFSYKELLEMLGIEEKELIAEG